MAGPGAGRRSGPSLAGRFAAAIALTVGFYVLALAITGALLGAAILPWALNGSNNIGLTIAGLVLGGSILVAIFPRRNRFEAPGVRLSPADQPALLELIDEEARACGERPPDEVYATFEVNAAVTEAGRRRRVMIVGLPLLEVVSERGLRSVVAHEFGHYAGGDTRLGPWIYRTREAILRTVAQLTDEEEDEWWAQKAVRLPFIWYAKAFLRITNAISRRQEYAADALAARRAGRDVHVATLRRIHAYAPVFDAYWANEVVPVLNAGRRPPVVEGFARFKRAETIEQAAAEQLERELAEAASDPYDSHPSLAERIAAVQDCPAGAPDDTPPAAALLRDAPALETALATQLLGPGAARELRPIDWDAVAREVYLERAHGLVAGHGDLLGELTVADLADAPREVGRLAGSLQQREPELATEYAAELGAALMADGMLTALHERGWSVEAPPGQPLLCRRGDDVLAPHVIVDDLRHDRLEADAWRRRAAELGIAELPLEPQRVPAAST
jgi:heat shock protein HtpX